MESVDKHTVSSLAARRAQLLAFTLIEILVVVAIIGLLVAILLPSLNRAREQAKMLLRELGMGDRLYHLPTELSGGQQQRVAVARALINQPAIILGDEPTGDLDSTTSSDVMDLFRRINTSNHQTFVLVTHNRWIAEKCDYIVHMTDGKIAGREENPLIREATKR